MSNPYDNLTTYYQKYIGKTARFNEAFTLVFDLKEKKWMSLLKALSKVKLPQLYYICLYSVPPDSDDVRSFISNSFSKLSQLYFNLDLKTEVEDNKYLDALKIAASKNINHIILNEKMYTAKEFCEFVASVKKSNKEIYNKYRNTLCLSPCKIFY